MLGRKDFTRQELDHARATIDRQLAAYRALETATHASGDKDAVTALEAFEPLFFDNLALTLDRFFVHRLRSVTGKDGNPLNELELIADSLLNNGGTLRGNNVIKYRPDDSVLELRPGDTIALRLADFERLADAFFVDLERKFVTA